MRRGRQADGGPGLRRGPVSRQPPEPWRNRAPRKASQERRLEEAWLALEREIESKLGLGTAVVSRRF